MLSIKMPRRPLPMIASRSGAHLAAIAWPKPLRRLYVVRDLDAAGDAAWSTLCERACTDDIEIHALMAPTGADMNDALIAMGVDTLGRALASQLTAEDAERFVIVCSRPPRESPRGPGLREGRSGDGAGPAQRLAAAIFRRAGSCIRFAGRDQIA